MRLADGDFVESPCVRICELRGDVCVGCGRTIEEICDWPFLRPDEQRTIKKLATERLLDRSEHDSVL
ncbi:MAG: DUF1289 domain-containing protein [Fimbriimonadaceae bacterium]|nr:DUF1289 domain-containing protein [Fimbriimonadaceae bacterium]